MHIPLFKGGDISAARHEIASENYHKIISKLCGAVAEREGKIQIHSSSLLPKYKILHLIFTYNVYPRLKNKSQLSDHMINILYAVAMGRKICLPSLICEHIKRFWKSSVQSSVPFCYLITRLGTHFGMIPYPGEVPLNVRPLTKIGIERSIGPSRPSSGGSPISAPSSAHLPRKDATSPSHSFDRKYFDERIAEMEKRQESFLSDVSKRQDRLLYQHQEFSVFVRTSLRRIFCSLQQITDSCRRTDAEFPPPSPQD